MDIHSETQERYRLLQVEYALIFGLLLFLLQIADGVLTSVGVCKYGICAEGNPFVRGLMGRYGFVEGLLLAKILATSCIAFLVYLASKLPWIANAMGAVSCVYVYCAIIPWTVFLFASN